MNARKHMNKAEAVEVFKREVVPGIKRFERLKGHTGKLTRTTLGSAWVEYIDSLERSGYISMKQAADWDNPFNR